MVLESIEQHLPELSLKPIATSIKRLRPAREVSANYKVGADGDDAHEEEHVEQVPRLWPHVGLPKQDC